jgi:hypothetical protein
VQREWGWRGSEYKGSRWRKDSKLKKNEVKIEKATK